VEQDKFINRIVESPEEGTTLPVLENSTNPQQGDIYICPKTHQECISRMYCSAIKCRSTGTPLNKKERKHLNTPSAS